MDDVIICYSPKGLAHVTTWGTLRETANAASLKLLFAPSAVNASETAKHECWAARQLGLMTGDWGRSFVAGWGTNPPVKLHHRWGRRGERGRGRGGWQRGLLLQLCGGTGFSFALAMQHCYTTSLQSILTALPYSLACCLSCPQHQHVQQGRRHPLH